MQSSHGGGQGRGGGAQARISPQISPAAPTENSLRPPKPGLRARGCAPVPSPKSFSSAFQASAPPKAAHAKKQRGKVAPVKQPCSAAREAWRVPGRRRQAAPTVTFWGPPRRVGAAASGARQATVGFRQPRAGRVGLPTQMHPRRGATGLCRNAAQKGKGPGAKGNALAGRGVHAAPRPLRPEPDLEGFAPQGSPH